MAFKRFAPPALIYFHVLVAQFGYFPLILVEILR